MADTARQLQDSLKKLAKSEQHDYLILATVKEVSEEDRLCTCVDEFDIELHNVSLQASSVNAGILLLPKVGSAVVLAHIGANVFKVLMTSEVDKVFCNEGNTTIEVSAEGVNINADAVSFNGGDNGGLINVGSLVAKVNALESDLNMIKTAFAGWVVVPADGGAALKAASATWAAQPITTTKVEDIEDNKITH